MASIFPESLDYSDKDQEALEARLYAVIRSVYPTWTATDVANFGNILISAFAFIGDVLTYYQDNQALEARITTAQLRRSMLGLTKLIGYRPAGATASQVDVTFTIASGSPTASILIPADTVVRTGSSTNPVEFRTLVATQIDVPNSQTSVTTTAENSVPAFLSVEATSVASQELALPDTPYLDDSASVSASNGIYTEVTDFLGSGPDDRHYTVTVDERDAATIRFGDGTSGTIPTGTINTTYRTGGGAGGVVPANTVTTVDSSFSDDLGNQVQLSVNNAEASTEAVDRQSVNEIRIEAPQSLRVLNRTVSREDYEIGANSVPGVGRALMLTSNEDPGIGENQGRLYVVSSTGGVPTQAVLDDVLEAVTVTKPNTLTFRVDVLPAPLLVVTISTVVHLNEGFTLQQAAADIGTNLTGYFDPVLSGDRQQAGLPQVDFGYNFAESIASNDSAIPLSDIENEIYRVAAVRKIDDRPDGVTMNGVREDLDVLLAQFPVRGVITVIDVATSESVVIPA
jgi:hypothetical protein